MGAIPARGSDGEVYAAPIAMPAATTSRASTNYHETKRWAASRVSAPRAGRDPPPSARVTAIASAAPAANRRPPGQRLPELSRLPPPTATSPSSWATSPGEHRAASSTATPAPRSAAGARRRGCRRRDRRAARAVSRGRWSAAIRRDQRALAGLKHVVRRLAIAAAHREPPSLPCLGRFGHRPPRLVLLADVADVQRSERGDHRHPRAAHHLENQAPIIVSLRSPTSGEMMRPVTSGNPTVAPFIAL
jgi:hypothetical protein